MVLITYDVNMETVAVRDRLENLKVSLSDITGENADSLDSVRKIRVRT